MLGDDYPFALCLTHDVDRPYKRVRAVYAAVMDRDPRHLRALWPGHEPYWQFDTVMAIEEELNVRSAFYFLNEQNLIERPPWQWVTKQGWQLHTDRYTLTEPDIIDVIHDLHDGGWEIGLHGSYESYHDPDRLAWEKTQLEDVLGGPIDGGRQHYLNLEIPETWEAQSNAGLQYDTTLGSSTTYGFNHGYKPFRPFNDEFIEFPLTLMELALPSVESNPSTAWAECEELLQEAKANNAVMTVLWHPRFFYDDEYPNYGMLYRRLIERAIDLGAWVGPPGELYERLPGPQSSGSQAVADGSERSVMSNQHSNHY